MATSRLSVFVDRVALALPPGASLVPAMMTFHNVQARLGYGVPEAFIAGAFVEGMGFVTVTTALDIYEMNQAEADPARRQVGQFWVAVGGTVFYLVVVIALNALMDDGDALKKVTLGMLSSLSIVGGLMIALRKNMAKRQAENEQAKLDEQAAQERQKAEEKEEKERLEIAARLERERLAEEQRLERQAKREMRLAEKRLEIELRLAESRQQVQPVAAGVAESVASSVVSGGKSLRWSLLSDSDKQRVIATMRECQAEKGQAWKKSAAVTVQVAFGLDERQAYKWLEYAERDAEKFMEVTA